MMIFAAEMSKKIKSWKHKTGAVPKNTQLLEYCIRAFPSLGSKSAVKKALKEKRISYNGEIAQGYEILNSGDQIIVKGNREKNFKKFEMDLPIIFEDEHLLVVNKPGGIAVNGNRFKTVENALIGHTSRAEDALARPIATHRIDVPTNGLVLLAKTKTALIHCNKAFQNKKVDKLYVAIVHGSPEASGEVDSPIQNKHATTKYRVIKTVSSRFYRSLSLMELKPLTGRTHQLRIHMANIGHPILGDTMYLKGRKTILGKGVFLTAQGIRIEHPISKEMMQFKIPIPKKFNKVLDREKRISSS